MVGSYMVFILNILRIGFDDLFLSIEQGSVLLLLVLVTIAHVVVTKVVATVVSTLERLCLQMNAHQMGFKRLLLVECFWTMGTGKVLLLSRFVHLVHVRFQFFHHSTTYLTRLAYV